MPGTTTVLGLTTVVGSDPVDIPTHFSTGVSQKVEDLLTGAAYPAGNLTIDFNSASNRTLTVKNSGAGTGLLQHENTISPITSDGAALGSTSLMYSDLFLASGAVVNFNNGDVTLTHSANTLAFAGASSGYAFDASVTLTAAGASGMIVGGTITTGAPIAYSAQATLVSNSTNSLMGSIYAASAITVNGGVTMTRAAQVWIDSITATVTGTLTNHNSLYVGTPTNGSTVKTIDTASGAGTPAHLTTGGTWTNASSWASVKNLLATISDKEADGWFEYLLAPESVAYRYRYPAYTYEPGELKASGQPAAGGEIKTSGHQDYEYDTIFPILDPMPDSLREAITTDAGGGVGTKDMEGWLYVMLRRACQRIAALEAKVH